MKYPRTYHVPYSETISADDKRLASTEHFLNKPLVITEKLDGSNVCLLSDILYARSHGAKPTHPSFDLLKAIHANIRYAIPENLLVFGEWCYAVHSIKYNALDNYLHIFGAFDGSNWWSWSDVCALASELGVPTAPVLFTGEFQTEESLAETVISLAKQSSVFDGIREGVVIRVAGEFTDFSKSVAKWVRANHVQTDVHWAHKSIEVQGLA